MKPYHKVGMYLRTPEGELAWRTKDNVKLDDLQEKALYEAFETFKGAVKEILWKNLEGDAIVLEYSTPKVLKDHFIIDNLPGGVSIEGRAWIELLPKHTQSYMTSALGVALRDIGVDQGKPLDFDELAEALKRYIGKHLRMK